MMSQEERINHLRGFVMSPVWLEIILPTYQQKLQAEVAALVNSEEGEEVTRGALGIIRWALDLPFALAEKRENKRRRGRIRMLHKLIEWPVSEVLQDVEDKRRAEALSTDEARWQHFAEFGFKSPVSFPYEGPLPEPGVGDPKIS